MKIEITEQNGMVIATFDGRLDTPTAIKITDDVKKLVENADKEIHLDCEKLEYISSSGLRQFLSIRKAASSKGGKVIIEHISNDIKQVFAMTGFYNLFEIR